jgi:hypothetical protein
MASEMAIVEVGGLFEWVYRNVVLGWEFGFVIKILFMMYSEVKNYL